MERIKEFIVEIKDFIVEILVATIGIIVNFVDIMHYHISSIKFEYNWWKISRNRKKELKKNNNYCQEMVKMKLFKKIFKKIIDEEISNSIKKLEKHLNDDIKYKAVFGLAQFILHNSHFIGIKTNLKDCISKSMGIFASNLIDNYEKYERMKLYWSMEFDLSKSDYDWYMKKYNEAFLDEIR